jgi:hypothetical protein
MPPSSGVASPESPIQPLDGEACKLYYFYPSPQSSPCICPVRYHNVHELWSSGSLKVKNKQSDGTHWIPLVLQH